MTAHPTLSHPSRTVPSAVTLPGSALEGTRRPAPVLLSYYALRSLLAGPGFPFLLLYLFFRFRTLRYTFDADGVTVRWGILFRREVSLTYARIQDIHLTSNLVERWLGLGRVQVQTASGNAAAELTIEGLPDYERVRDELYVRMRGARGLNAGVAETARSEGPSEDLPVSGDLAEVARALNIAVQELRAIRESLGNRP
jgi:putative membrane protein